MNIKLELDGLTIAQAENVMAVLGGGTPDPVQVKAAEPGAEVAEVAEAAEVTEDATAGPATADDLISALNAKFKRSKTASLKDGERAEDGDEVVTEDGEVGVIAACYRGRVVVEFEDGRAEEIASSSLTFNAQEDTPASNGHDTSASAVEPEPEPEVEIEDAERVVDEGEGELTLQSLQDEMAKVMKIKGRGVAIGILKQFKVRKMSDLGEGDYASMMTTLQEAHA